MNLLVAGPLLLLGAGYLSLARICHSVHTVVCGAAQLMRGFAVAGILTALAGLWIVACWTTGDSEFPVSSAVTLVLAHGIASPFVMSGLIQLSDEFRES